MDTTRGASSSSDPAAGEGSWVLTLACSPRLEAIGTSLLVPRGVTLPLGRHHQEFGPDALADRRISREHARLRVDDDGTLVVEDCGSHNGTRLNGRRVSVASLQRDDVLAMGGVVLHVDWDTDSRVTGAVSRLEQELQQVAEHASAVLLCGDAGTGKSWCAQRLHEGFGRSGTLVVIDSALVRDDDVDESLLAPADGGTLVVEGLEGAGPRLQAHLSAVLDHGRTQGPGAIDARVVATSRRTPLTADTGTDAALLARIGRWTMHLAPLAARRHEIPRLAAAIVQQLAGEPIPIRARFMHELLVADYPANVHDLEATLARALHERQPGEPLAAVASAKPRAAPRPPAASGPAFELDGEGRWLSAGEGERAELEHRPVLMRVLAALVTRYAEARGQVLTAEQLIEVAWPDEKLTGRAGINRLYVAISTLRKLGLGQSLERTRSGYRLDPSARIRVSAPGESG
ncbi:MAG: FHA domain-containing protein [Myxococcota bacterium]